MLPTPSKADCKYLRLLRSGMPVAHIARKCKVTAKTVYNGLERARLAEKPITASIPRPPRLEPLFPITSFVPSSTCPHRGPTIRKGSVFVCAVCHATGIENHPALRRDPRTDPRRERRQYVADGLRGGMGA